MFNPKQNLLEEQLATSGLEMQWGIRKTEDHNNCCKAFMCNKIN